MTDKELKAIEETWTINRDAFGDPIQCTPPVHVALAQVRELVRSVRRLRAELATSEAANLCHVPVLDDEVRQLRAGNEKYHHQCTDLMNEVDELRAEREKSFYALNEQMLNMATLRESHDRLLALLERSQAESRCGHAADPCSWCMPVQTAIEQAKRVTGRGVGLFVQVPPDESTHDPTPLPERRRDVHTVGITLPESAVPPVEPQTGVESFAALEAQSLPYPEDLAQRARDLTEGMTVEVEPQTGVEPPSAQVCDTCNGTGMVQVAPNARGVKRCPACSNPVKGTALKPPGLSAPQPPPKPGIAPHTVDLVMADLLERKAFGIAKYGVPHQHDNGRDHLVDAYNESQDLTLYLRAEIAKRASKPTAEDVVRRYFRAPLLECPSCHGVRIYDGEPCLDCASKPEGG